MLKLNKDATVKIDLRHLHLYYFFNKKDNKLFFIQKNFYLKNFAALYYL